MKAATEAVYLPMLFLTVALLGGLRVDERVTFVAPPLFALVLGMMLFGVLVRGRVLAPERLMSASREPLENLIVFVEDMRHVAPAPGFFRITGSRLPA